MRKLAFAAILSAFSLAPTMAAAVVYDEAVNGDLSGVRLTPTSLGLLSNGINSISGNTTQGDLDYVTFRVASGSTLNAIILGSYTSTNDLGFMAIQAGTAFTEPTVATNVANLLGYTHFGPGFEGVPAGGDTLVKMGAGPGAIGFIPPLGAGDYTLWIQQTQPQSIAYRFDIAVVPEPSSLALLGVGLAGLLVAARRKT